ncbi:endoplasmic reticulum membrane protein complex subunit 7-like [Tubulanus polymorphus]|uniref:endoplasmic reticulum membrane protein complex subunit 7-like n=1 Tax=Tubulanus polymorphus TaxID=672921 RepID=UPI003DA42D6F
MESKAIFFVFFCFVSAPYIPSFGEEVTGAQKFKIEGKVSLNHASDQNWISFTRILVNGGEYIGFLRSDGHFVVNNLPSGSYLVEVANPTYLFEASRVDITSKGKIRSRKVNNIQTSSVQTMAYPLRFKPRGKANYFQIREQWRITDLLFNPMVLMMVLPLLLIMVVPKLVNTNDPETQREMANQMNILNTKQQLPDMSEMVTSLFGGGKKPAKSKTSKVNKSIR